MSPETTWPKVLPPLDPELEALHDDFIRQWHEVLPQQYGVIEHFNHRFPVRNSRPGFVSTLEIGAGLGEHLQYETLTPAQRAAYYALELRENMAERIAQNFPEVNTVVGDCQRRLQFSDGYFHRYLAIHVLEHLPNLPACLAEAWRLLDKTRGQMLVVIPCEGGLAYGLARRISAQRLFEKTYGTSYKPFIEREHINRPHEILHELDRWFTIDHRRYFPFALLPVITGNLVIGLSLTPRKTPLA